MKKLLGAHLGHTWGRCSWGTALGTVEAKKNDLKHSFCKLNTLGAHLGAPSVPQVCLVYKNCASGHFCLNCAPSVPQVCPSCALTASAPSVPQVTFCPNCAPTVPNCAPSVPQEIQFCAPSVPQLCLARFPNCLTMIKIIKLGLINKTKKLKKMYSTRISVSFMAHVLLCTTI